MGNNNESVVLPVLDCLCSPKAATPHTNIFSMHKKKQFVAKAVCLKATPVATLHDIAQILKLQGATRIQFHFRRYRVTCCCKCGGYSYGSSMPTLQLAVADLLSRIERGYSPNTKIKA